MPKNILIFADGTGQAGGIRPDQQLSNIYKLYRATRVGPENDVDPAEQVAYYDPGLGTATSDGHVVFGIGERIASVAGLAAGLGFSRNVIDCYEAILKSYEPGDRIYLFGFSRGGYTVRSLANVLNLCGVPTTDGIGGPLPRAGNRLRSIATEAVTRVYEHGAGHPRAFFEAQREALAREFREKYRSGDHPSRGEVFPEFVGVFDSVAALGLNSSVRLALWILGIAILAAMSAAIGFLLAKMLGWAIGVSAPIIFGSASAGIALLYLKRTLRFAPKRVRGDAPSWHLAAWSSKHYDAHLDDRIPQVRHALAIDETRTHFSRVTWGGSKNARQAHDRRFQQRWFAGNHSDIGGSYPEDESRLSDIALRWMVEEAMKCSVPLIVDQTKLNLFPSAAGRQHCEVFAQKQKPWYARIYQWPSAPRAIDPDAELDPSVLERFSLNEVVQCDRVGAYRPRALANHNAVRHYYSSTS